MSSLHVSFSPDIKKKLATYASKRSISQAALIRYALDKLYEQEDPSGKHINAMRDAITKRFAIPSKYTVNSFFATLYMHAERYPNKSSKGYWTGLLYLDDDDKTHRQVFDVIKEDIKKALDG